MNYQEEYYNLIENQIFYHLPDQQMINYDERVALAIMKTYRNRVLYNEYEYDSYDKFKEIKFNEILYMYKNNKAFWEKTDIKNLILEQGFREQFPEISFQFLSDKQFVISLLNKNNNLDLINNIIPPETSVALLSDKELLLELVSKDDNFALTSLNSLISKEEFERLEKSFLLSKGSLKSEEDIAKYENDKEFIIEMVKKDKYLYPKLSDTLKNDTDIINTYLLHNDSILSFTKEKQNELFVPWARLHRDWDMKIIDQLDYDYLKPIMKRINKTNNELLMKKLLSRNVDKYKEVIIDFFEQNKNSEYFLKMLKENSLEKLSPVLKGLDCTEYVIKWINDFSYKAEDKFDTKMLYIMKLYPELQTKWESSFDGKIFKQINNKEPLSFDDFREALNIQFEKLNQDKINYEKLESNMLKLKTYLPVSVLKEMRIPNKSIVEYLQHMKFNEKFVEKGITEKKPKI